jgi:uncharacterized glyoxalase superfamily protein PhnB
MPSHIYTVARYERAIDAIEWLCRAFGFESRAVHPGPNGSVAHAELAFGDGMFGLSSAGPVDPANVWTTVREGVYVCADDVDALHARALGSGARIEVPLHDTDYGSRDFTARDPEGRLWAFGTYAMGPVPDTPAFWPNLKSRDGRQAVEFLSRAFGLNRGLEVAEDRVVRHAELWTGSGVVMVDAGADPHGCWSGRTQCTHAFVADPDAHHAVAAAAGAHIVRPPETTPYGSRGYVVQDLEGFLWSFSTYRPARPAPG